MSNFPLYTSLSRDLPKKDLTAKQKEEFIQKIKKLDSNGRNLVYTLIQFHFINENGEFLEDLPYDGTREKTGTSKKDDRENLTWSLTDLPTSLRHILYKFVNLHIQNMEEEMNRFVL